ncbi:hypothetical protein K1X76_00770 [bacterium]|nr:hypothetical protein [bacterium]
MNEGALFQGIKKGQNSDFIEFVRQHQTTLYHYLTLTQLENRAVEIQFISLFSSLLNRILKSRKYFPLKESLFKDAHSRARTAMPQALSREADAGARLQNLSQSEMELLFFKVVLGFSFAECEAVFLKKTDELKALLYQSFFRLFPDFNLTESLSAGCKKFDQSLVDYVCRTSSAGERETVTKHVQYCQNCNSKLNRLAPFLRQLEANPPPNLPAPLSLALNEKTRDIFDIYKSKSVISRRFLPLILVFSLIISLVLTYFYIYRPFFDNKRSNISKYQLIEQPKENIGSPSLIPAIQQPPTPLPAKDDDYTTFIPLPSQTKQKPPPLAHPPEIEFIKPASLEPMEKSELDRQHPSSNKIVPSSTAPSVADKNLNDNSETDGITKPDKTEIEEKPLVFPAKAADKKPASAITQDGPVVECDINQDSDLVEFLNESIKQFNQAQRSRSGEAVDTTFITEANMSYNINISDAAMTGQWFRIYIDLKQDYMEWQEALGLSDQEISEYTHILDVFDEMTYNNTENNSLFIYQYLNSQEFDTTGKPLYQLTLYDPEQNITFHIDIINANSSQEEYLDFKPDPCCH